MFPVLFKFCHAFLYILVKALYECNTGNIARGAGSRGSYSTRRSRVLYDASRPRPECNISRITRVYGALTGLLCSRAVEAC